MLRIELVSSPLTVAYNTLTPGQAFYVADEIGCNAVRIKTLQGHLSPDWCHYSKHDDHQNVVLVPDKDIRLVAVQS